MKILFVHQNMPGQYKHLAPALASDPANQVIFLTKEGKPQIEGIEQRTYKVARGITQNIHPYLRRLEDQVLHGQAVVRTGIDLVAEGFQPDVICAHSGWGEALFLREVFPDARILVYCEFFYRSRGADTDFNPNQQQSIDSVCRTRMNNTHMLVSLEAADWGFSPTEWQRSRHPQQLRDKIAVVHDGVDTEICQAQPDAWLDLPNGKRLNVGDEVVTYLARNLEQYRGFDQFMQSLGEICRRRPNAEIVVVGGDEVSYGDRPSTDENWRERMLASCPLDPFRVHFLGRVPYNTYRRILSISSAHIYLTYPFVLSWSALEAMSHECLLIASNTTPVTEVIEDGVNGVLVDFFDPRALADVVCKALESPDEYAGIRAAARETVVSKYDLRTVCLPAQLDLVKKVASGEWSARGDL